MIRAMTRAATFFLVLLAAAACTEHGRDPTTANGLAVTAPANDLQDTTTLFGLPAEGVSALFGEPRLTRRDGPAQVWQYANAVCVLDLFLYSDADPTRPEVTYFEAREGGNATLDPLPCVRSLLRRSPQGA
jgi:hypothetical protein